MAIKCFEDDYNGGWWCDGCGPNGDLWHHWVGDPQTQAGADASCQNAFTAPGGQPNELAPMNKIRERGVDNSRRYPIFRGGKGKPKKQARRKMQFGGMNPVRQRSISVNPSQGGFFAVPQDERNFGQQSALPYEEQLNFSHSNASGCGYSNMNHGHSNFGANTASTTWSGAQTNVGPQDRIFAGNYANGRRRR